MKVYASAWKCIQVHGIKLSNIWKALPCPVETWWTDRKGLRGRRPFRPSPDADPAAGSEDLVLDVMLGSRLARVFPWDPKVTATLEKLARGSVTPAKVRQSVFSGAYGLWRDCARCIVSAPMSKRTANFGSLPYSGCNKK